MKRLLLRSRPSFWERLHVLFGGDLFTVIVTEAVTLDGFSHHSFIANPGKVRETLPTELHEKFDEMRPW